LCKGYEKNIIWGLPLGSELKHKITPKACISSIPKELHIIKAERFVYHQAAGQCTLKRDEIQERQAALDDIHLASRGDDIPSLRLG